MFYRTENICAVRENVCFKPLRLVPQERDELAKREGTARVSKVEVEGVPEVAKVNPRLH